MFSSMKILPSECFVFPDLNVPIPAQLSEHTFFREKNINILQKSGKKGSRLNQYEHLNREPVWKPMLECECEILQGNNVNENENVCVNGKIVNLSRGVGGDRSFFVHALTSSGSFKVVAHLYYQVE